MLKDLLRYTDVADQIIIDIFNKAEGLELTVAEYLFSHVLNAQHIWLSRINNTEPLFERFQVHSRTTFENLHKENFEKLYEVLEQSDLERVISYRISTGQAFESRIDDILFHVVNHSTYHRGQIASQFRLAGITPPVTDYVLLRRQGLF